MLGQQLTVYGGAIELAPDNVKAPHHRLELSETYRYVGNDPGFSLLQPALFSSAGDCPAFIAVSDQVSLESLMAGYPSCEHIETSVSISGAVSDLSPLANIKSIGVDLSVNQTTMLTSLNGLQSLTTVGRQLFISENEMLQTLAGLENVESVGGNFTVQYNDVLNSVSEVSSLTTVGATFSINNNPVLNSVSGYNALQTANNLGIEGQSLATISGFGALLTADEFVALGSGAPCVVTAFQNLAQVGQLSLGDGLQSVDFPNLESITNDFLCYAFDLTEMKGFNNLVTVGGDVILNTAAADLPNFNSLQSVGKRLVFDSRETLTIIDGFNNLETIGTGQLTLGLDVYDHDALETISGFNKLREIEGALAFDFCDNLQTIEGFASLEKVDFNFVIRNNPKLEDCSAFCDFLRDGTIGGTAIVSNNGQSENSACHEFEILQRSCSFTYDLIDANLLLDLDDYSSTAPNNIRDKTFVEILELDAFRQAVAADGVSAVLLKLQFEMEGTVAFPDNPENIEMLWGEATRDVDGENILYALFTPPDEFDSEQEASSLNGEVDKYDIDINVELTTSEEERSNSEVLNFNMPVPIAKPPVVLVHGTLADPFTDWETSVDPNKSMRQVLEEAGYKVFAVDYEASNGSFGLIEDNSGFERNKMIVWGDVYDSNVNGIKDALRYYREELEVAVTQADVVGNDMGGLLARIYASDTEGGYNPDYRRAQNFMEGDINRLITIATPHLGSHFREFQAFLEDNAWSLPEFSVMDWLSQVAIVFYYWYNDYPVTQATIDQQPPNRSAALARIGATEVPAHAITCTVPFGRGSLLDGTFDPEEEYYDLFWYTTLLLYNNVDVREDYIDNYKLQLIQDGLLSDKSISGRDASEIVAAYDDLMYFKTMVEDGIWYAGQILAVMDGTWAPPAAATVFKYVFAEVGMSDYTDPLLDIIISGDLEGVLGTWYSEIVDFPSAEDMFVSYLSTNDKSMEVVRSFIFNNDYNDGVVSVKSQSGGLEDFCESCVTNIEDKVLHRFAPRYPAVQEAVIEELNGGMEHFREEGMPPTFEPVQLFYPDSVFDIFAVNKTGGAAARSGAFLKNRNAPRKLNSTTKRYRKTWPTESLLRSPYKSTSATDCTMFLLT